MSVRQSAVVVGTFWILHALYDLTHSQSITNDKWDGVVLNYFIDVTCATN